MATITTIIFVLLTAAHYRYVISKYQKVKRIDRKMLQQLNDEKPKAV